jgi:hypothetical protein
MSDATARGNMSFVHLDADGWRENTARLQSALDARHAAGGGTVSVSTGRAASAEAPGETSEMGAEIGHIRIPSFVTLEVQAGSVLRAAMEREAYEGSRFDCLVESQDTRHIGLVGAGVIDGRGVEFMKRDLRYIYEPREWRPRLIGLFGATDVTVRDITLRNGAFWTLHPIGCTRVTIDGITIDNDLKVPNCDGIDPDHCRDVRIQNCSIRAADDCIVLKNTKEFMEYGPCEGILVANCSLTSTSAAFKIGSESMQDFRDIVITGCVVRASNRGLAVQLRDPGSVENLTVSNCIIETRLFEDHYWGKAEAVYITALERFGQADEALPDWNPENRVGTVRGVNLSGLRIRGENGVVLYGITREDGSRSVEDVTLRDIRISTLKSSKWPAGRRDLRPRDALGPAFRNPEEDPGLETLPHSAVSAEGIGELALEGVDIDWQVRGVDGYGDPLYFRANGRVRMSTVNVEEQRG